MLRVSRFSHRGSPRSLAPLPLRSLLTRQSFGAAVGAEALESRYLLAATLSLGGTQDIIPGAMINAGGTTHGTTYQSEMTVSVNPANPLQVVGFSHTIGSPIDCEIFRSVDGGQTWTSNVIDFSDDGLSDSVFRFDPAIAFDTEGHLYVAYGHDSGVSRQLRVLRSDDAGLTFVENAQVDTGGGLDKWHLATGPRVNSLGQVTGQAVYIAYRNPAGSIMVAGSDNYGDTFTRTATKINDEAVDGANFAHPAVGPSGQVYVSWHDHEDGLIRFDRDLNGLEGGLTFGTDVTARTLTTNAVFDIIPAQPDRGIWNAPTLTADRSGGANNGRVYLTFADLDVGGGDNYDIFLTYSDDNGATWRNPNTGAVGALRVANPASSEFGPWVTVDQMTGMMGIAYYSSEIDSNGFNDDVGVRIATSTNGGSTYVFDWLSGANTSNESSPTDYGGDYLEYIGLGLHGGTAHGFWSFEPSPGSDDLEAMTARASFNSSTSGNMLSVTGDDGGVVTDDTIELRLSSANADYLEVFVNNIRQYTGLLATIDTINVNGLAGNDTVFLNFANGNLLTGVALAVNGGTGTDTIRATADQNMTLTNSALTVGALGSVSLTSIEQGSLTGGGSANALNASSFTAGMVTLIGLGGNDTLTGGSGGDVLEGGAGNDSLVGNAGGDTYVWSGSSNLGSDTVDETGTNTGSPDVLDFTAFAAGVQFNMASTALQPASPLLSLTFTSNSVFRLENVTTSQLGAYADYITGNSLDNRIDTWDGVDNLYGGWGNDTLVGGEGDDTMIGDHDSASSSNGPGSDHLYGGGGADLMYGDHKNASFVSSSYGNGNDIMFGGPGNDQMQGDALLGSISRDGDDSLYGEDGDDALWGDTGPDYDPANPGGSYGDDIINGGKGNDVLRGQEGADRYYWSSDQLGPASQTDTLVEYSGGGSGDTLDFSAVSQVVTLDLSSAASSQTVIAGLLVFSFPLGSSAQYFEHASGGSAGDTITGNASFNILHGYGGNDTLVGGDGIDWMYGDNDNDSLRGGNGNDSVFGNDGNDVLEGEANNDRLEGGNGDDALTGGADNDTLLGGTGNDTYYFAGSTSLGSDTLTEGVNADTDTINLSGLGVAANLLLWKTTAHAVATILTLTNTEATGIENAVGTSFNDLIEGNTRNNVLAGGNGEDYLLGYEGADDLNGNDGNDHCYGGLGDDHVRGGSGADDLYGQEDNDVIYAVNTSADSGNVDGVDTLHGGTGSDTFFYRLAEDLLFDP